MQFLRIEDISPGMVLAHPIAGDNGNLLLNAGNQITSVILKRMTDMGFQGAYIQNPIFEDVIVDDVIPAELRAQAFNALKANNVSMCVKLAKQFVRELEFKDIPKLDLLDIKDSSNYTIKHCISVCIFSIIIGMGCKLGKETIENLAVAGMLHDIGKFQVKKRVLRSKGIYKEKDMEEMQKHPIRGFEFLQSYPEIKSVSRNAILFHHENLDGTGYFHISQEKLSIFPRILRVADTYDAMTAQKTYRGAFSPAQAIDYIMSNVDTMFDREIVDVFVRHFPVYPIGFTIKLSNGEVAVVVSNDSNPLRPKIRKLDGTDIDLASDPAYLSILIEGIL